jgi:hypothetical protein
VGLACPRRPGCSVLGPTGHAGLDAQAAPLYPPQSMRLVAGVLASRVKTYDTGVPEDAAFSWVQPSHDFGEWHKDAVLT